MTLSQALRTPEFHVFTLSNAGAVVLFTGVLYNFANIFNFNDVREDGDRVDPEPAARSDTALSEEQILTLQTILTAVVPVVAVLTGAYIELGHKRYGRQNSSSDGDVSAAKTRAGRRRAMTQHYYRSTLVALLLQVIACALLGIQSAGAFSSNRSHFALATAFIAVFATLPGMLDVLFNSGVVFADCFGPRHLGAITGTTTGLLTFCNAFGPLLFGMCVERAHPSRGSSDGAGDGGAALRGLLGALAGLAGLDAVAILLLTWCAKPNENAVAATVGADDDETGEASVETVALTSPLA